MTVGTHANVKWKIKGKGITPYLCWKLNNYFKFPSETTPKYNSKNIMLNWVKNNIIIDKVEFNEKIPENIIYARGGIVINDFLICKGHNAYYEKDFNENI